MSGAVPLVYLHGLPGGPDEVSLVSDLADAFFAPDLRDGSETEQIVARLAGGPIFRMARDHSRLFFLTTQVQAIVARAAPDFFARQVFAHAAGKDTPLAADAAFRRAWSASARHCLAGGASAYRAEIAAYVKPWSDLLSTVSAPVTIWYGTADNWVPPAMADALAERLPNVVCVRQIMDGGHYSTLAAALPHIAGADASLSGEAEA